MKRLFPLIIIVSLSTYAWGQNQMDALRYSETFANGTARSMSMAGAFGALGGDFYSASQNPAGLGVYRRSEFVFSPSIYFNNVDARYNGTTSHDNSAIFNFSNLSYVSSFNFGSKGLVGGSFGVGVNRVNNFRSNMLISGNNVQSSLADVYVESANDESIGGPFEPSELLPFTEQLFYDGYIIDRDAEGYYYVSTEYRDSIANTVNLDQTNNIERYGKTNEWLFSLGFNYGHFFYFGGSLNIVSVDFEENSAFRETPLANPNDQYIFSEKLRTSGTGYQGKFGMIVKPVKFLRVGLAYHTPTAYYLSDDFNTSMDSPFTSGVLRPADYELGTFEYEIVTPGKAVGSLGLVLGKYGVLSTDVEYIDYTKMRFILNGQSADDQSYFSDVNTTIDAIYTQALNIKVGAEVRLSNFYVRGGYGYYGSPYASGEVNENSYRINYTGGIGFRSEDFFMDLGISYLMYDEEYILYDSNYATRPASTSLAINSINSVLTMGFRF